MFDPNNFDEPEVDPLADTNPSISIRPVDLRGDGGGSGWRRVVGVFSLLGAAAFTIATIAILLLPAETPESPAPAQPTDLPSTETIEQTPFPTETPATAVADTAVQVAVMPTVSSETIAALLSAQPVPVAASAGEIPVIKAPLKPFTIIPDRPRSEVIQYEAVRGDTIYTIAQRFNLEAETIAWSNARRIVQVLRPGDIINVLPVDGVYHTAIANRTLAEIAAQYGVDVYAVIDSEYNNLFGATPDTIPPSGTRLVIPGGKAEEITWNPTVVREGDGSSGGSSSAAYITFAPGQAGSCGRVVNPGGGAYWVNPLPNGTWVRGFTSWHTGIDVSAPVGTTVVAANGGRVIFAGWNSWGYGNTVVLAHGPFTTLYGHLSTINVGCNQDVVPGQVIAGVGNTGNSSGPHLHFEVRYNDIPADPTSIGVGW